MPSLPIRSASLTFFADGALMTIESYACDRLSSTKAAAAALPLVLAMYASGMELFGTGFSYWGAIGACAALGICLTAVWPSAQCTGTGYGDLSDDPFLWRFVGTAYAALGTLVMCALCARDPGTQRDVQAAAALIGDSAAALVPLPFVYVLMATLRRAFVEATPADAAPSEDHAHLAPWQAALLDFRDGERPG